MLTVIDLDKKETYGIEYWFSDEVDAPNNVQTLVYVPNATICSNEEKLMYACGEGRFLDVISFDGTNVIGHKTIYDILPDYTVSRSGLDYHLSPNSDRGMRVRTTNNRIYVLLSMFHFENGVLTPEAYKGYPRDYFDELEVYD